MFSNFSRILAIEKSLKPHDFGINFGIQYNTFLQIVDKFVNVAKNLSCVGVDYIKKMDPLVGPSL
jgi:hypothetical protein